MIKIFSALKESWKLAYSNKLSFLCIVLFDFLFMLSFGIVTAVYLPKIAGHITAVNEMLGSNAYMLQNMNAEDISSWAGSIPQADFYASYSLILKYVFISVFFVFMLWCVFQSAALLKAYDVIKIRRQRYFPMLGRTALLSLVFLLGFAVIFSISASLAVRMMQSGIILASYSNLLSNILLSALFFALLYFYFIGMSLLHKYKAAEFKGLFKEMLVLGAGRSPYILLSAAILTIPPPAIIFAAVNYSLSISVLLATLLSIFLFIPILSFEKVWFIHTVNAVDKTEGKFI